MVNDAWISESEQSDWRCKPATIATLGSDGSGTAERFPKKGAISGTVGWPVARRGWKPLEFRRIALASGTGLAPAIVVEKGILRAAQTTGKSLQHAESAAHPQITATICKTILLFRNFVPDDFIYAPLDRSMIGATWAGDRHRRTKPQCYQMKSAIDP